MNFSYQEVLHLFNSLLRNHVSSIRQVALAIAFAFPAAICSGESLPSHCTNDEQVIFSCSIKSSKKVLSVCAAKSFNNAERYVQYRFGKPGAPEFRFPADRVKSIEQFKLSHYFRAKVDRRELLFRNKDVQYRIFSSFEGEDNPPLREAGVIIQKGRSERDWKTLQCASPYIDQLEKLDEVVTACDPDSALADGNCSQSNNENNR